MLTVYRASAGSGKTHLLTGTYLQLLFQDQTTFDNILAVTFTNKATEEMKERIISQLFVLSQDPEQSDYYDALKKQFQLSPEALRDKASKALKSILHNYSKYNVSTIDHFFQHVMRAFTREIGLQGGYNIELDQNKVLTKAVDMLIDDLNKSEHHDLLEWLMLFSQDKLENGQDWNIRRDLFTLSQEILKEEYKRNSDKILAFTADKKNLAAYIQELKSHKTAFEQEVQRIGQTALQLMQRHALKPQDFSGKSRSPFFFFQKWADGEIKEPTATFLKLENELDKWAPAKTTSDTKAQIEAAFLDGLNDCVVQIIEHFDSLLGSYLTITESLRYIYTVGILSDIDRNMRAYCREQNILLISDTTELLTKIIDGSDNPFVYEKLGTQIRHFMIDEFQDTSGMQWDNFRPLLQESIGAGCDNLIVGDVKQSIYRWRSSDWMLLHKQLRQFASEQRNDCVLNTNWRSAANIIGFNNAFFTMAAGLLQQKFNEPLPAEAHDTTIKEAYEDICQNVSPRKKDFDGHVRIEWIDADNWVEEALERMIPTLHAFQDHGYPLKEIAILVRSGREGAMVAKKLLDYKAQHPESTYRYDVISNDSLYIGQSETIRTIVSFMKFLLEPQSPILQTLAAYNMLINLSEKDPDQAIRTFFYEKTDVNKLFVELFEEPIGHIRSLPLYEMTEKIISLVSNPDDMRDKVYVQAFQDLVMEYISTQAAELSSFIQWWDEKGFTKTISSPDDQDAIRIMTIHKSKGLGFKAVILPFASWKIDNDPFMTNIIWSEPQIEPFNMLPLIPVRYGKNLIKTIYKDDFLHEKLQTYIDNLNVAYVAFTRAEESMVIFAPKVKDSEKQNDIASLLLSCAEWAKQPESDMPMLTLNQHYDPVEYIFEAGTWVNHQQKEKSNHSQIVLKSYPSVDPSERLQLRLHGKGYFNDREERIYGTLMHEILSSIRYPDEIEAAVQQFVHTGAILQGQAAALCKRIASLLTQDPLIEQWFHPEAHIHNETEILVSEGSFLRPDRIVQVNGITYVVDYKFGHVERDSYAKQVAGYVKLLQAMGFVDVRGYLWYVERKKIVPIQQEAQLSLF